MIIHYVELGEIFHLMIDCKSGNIYKTEKVVLITTCLYFLYYDFYY